MFCKYPLLASPLLSRTHLVAALFFTFLNFFLWTSGQIAFQLYPRRLIPLIRYE